MQIALKEDLDSLKEKLRTSAFHFHYTCFTLNTSHVLLIVKCKRFNVRLPSCSAREITFYFNVKVLPIFLLTLTVESSQKASSHEIPKLNEDLKAKQRTLEDIESGDKGLNKLWANLTDINRKVRLSTSD